MIKYNNSNINDWYYDTSNIIKVYRNNAVCYYKISDTPPTPPTPTSKWIATYVGGTTSSAECDASSAITSGEITLSNLVSVEIGDCVTSIGYQAFYQCSGLTSCTIGSGVTSIGSQAFRYCSGLTSIDILDSVTNIGSQAFNNCRSLTSCTIGSGVTTIGVGVFQNCTSLTSIDIPNSVASIGNYAFNWCTSLTSIDIPSGVASIGESAFRYCTSLTSITIEAATPPTLGTNVFNNTTCPIYVPSESVDTYKEASRWSEYASRIQAIP